MPRFRNCLVVGLFLSTFLSLFLLASPAETFAEVIDVWIGTSRAKPSKGIYHATLNTDTGKLSTPALAAEIAGPGFLAMHPKETHLYAVGALDGKPQVAAYRIHRSNGKSRLQLVNAVEIGDGGAAHVAIDSTGQTLLTAQYGGGSVAVFRVGDDGSIQERTQLIEHKGGSRVVPRRQESPHPHWVGFSPDNRFAFVPDLGLDEVKIYRVDVASSRLEPHGHAKLPAGGGPRHMKFHPNGKWVYVLNELTLSVTVFDYDKSNGVMTAKQTIAAVPQADLDKEKFKSASEIRVHPTGHFVYSANRGHDTITVYEVDQKTGRLEVVEREFVRGATPRNFNLDPTARWLVAAGQDSHTLAVFEIQDDGELTYHRSIVPAPAPICVLFTHE